MNEVDYIGKKSVGEVIRLSKLTKFIVFQQGATKGSTPVFRCTDAKSVEKAERSFFDWADSILRMNPNNNRAYELFLYSARTSEAEIEDDHEERDSKEKSGTKTDKIRFSFSLNPYNNMYGNMNGMGGVNIAEEIKKGIDEYKKDQRLQSLEDQIRELRENGNSSNDDEEEEENAITQVSNLISLIRSKDGVNKLKKAAGDEDVADLDDDDDDDETVQTQTQPKTDSAKEQRVARLKIALQRIQKLDPEWKGLYKLSQLAKKNPSMFNSYMNTLLKMEF